MSVSFSSLDVQFRTKDVNKKKQWLQALAKLHGKEIGNLAIYWCSDSYMLESNNKYLSHNYYTDILTFDNSDETPGLVSGQLLISVDTVKSNSLLYSQKFHVEQLRVVAHGLLHLLGFDDHKPEDIVMMRKMEEIAINLYGIL